MKKFLKVFIFCMTVACNIFMLLMGLLNLQLSQYFLIKLKNFKIGLILLLNKVIVKISDFYDMLMPNFVSSFCKGKVQL